MRVPALVLLLAFSGLALGDESFPGVKRLMNAEDFQATGLNKLTPRELEALDAWLLRYTAGDAQVLQQTNEAVREAEQAHEVVSRIAGDFTGWDGETIFTLENGQRWQQRLQGRYFYNGPPHPEVRISRNWLGFYKMTVTATGRSIGVSPRE